MNRSFFRYFPPPPFLVMDAIGVHITDDFIRVIEFKHGTHGRSLKKFLEKKIPAGILENGTILKKEELVAALKEVKKEFGYEFVRATLPEEKSYVFKTELPVLADSAIGGAIEFKIQENVPIPAAEAIFDYSVIGREKDHLDVTVTVVQQTVVANYTDVFKRAGLTPLSFKVESQAVARAIIPNGEMKNTLIINFGEKQTGFYVVSHGVVQFASTLLLGSGSLTALIERHFKVSTDKALEIKKTRNFSVGGDNAELMYSISNSLSVIKDETNKVLAYWKSYTSKTGEEKPIERIILCGADVVAANVDRYVSLGVGIPVEVAHVWENAFNIRASIPNLPMVDSLDYAAAIGLALGPRRNHYV